MWSKLNSLISNHLSCTQQFWVVATGGLTVFPHFEKVINSTDIITRCEIHEFAHSTLWLTALTDILHNAVSEAISTGSKHASGPNAPEFDGVFSLAKSSSEEFWIAKLKQKTDDC